MPAKSWLLSVPESCMTYFSIGGYRKYSFKAAAMGNIFTLALSSIDGEICILFRHLNWRLTQADRPGTLQDEIVSCPLLSASDLHDRHSHVSFRSAVLFPKPGGGLRQTTLTNNY